MKIKFWGTRGSIPTPCPEYMKYGGDTACVDIRLSSGQRIIIDAGTGIRRLGISLVKDPDFNKRGALFISHCHWDHIQGFPFFQPAFISGYEFNIYGQFKLDGRLEDLIRGQMEHLYFPVKLDQMGSNIKFIELIEETIQIGESKVTSRHLKHPQGNMGFRIEAADGIIAYCTDTEHTPGEYDKKVLELADHADIFIYDTQYTEEEYKSHTGWGHSTWKVGTELAREAGAKQLILFHHDPGHDDAMMDKIVAQAQDHFENTLAASRDLEMHLKSAAHDTGTRKLTRLAKEEQATYHIEKVKDRLHITVAPSLEVFNSEKFVAEVCERIDSGLTQCIFDFTHLNEIDSRSLGTLAQFHEKVKNLGGRFILTHVNEFIKEVLMITRFTQLIEIQD